MFIFPGRFQPLHNGHESAIEQILKEVEKLTIAIVVKEYSFENPFSFFERNTMICELFREKGYDFNRITITPIFAPDVHNWLPNYYLLPRERIWYFADSDNRRYDNYTSMGEEVRVISRSEEISATKIREAIVNNKSWDKYVCPSVKKIIEDIDGINRIKTLFQKRLFQNRVIGGLIPLNKIEEIPINLEREIANIIINESEKLLRDHYTGLANEKKRLNEKEEHLDIIKDLEHVILVKRIVLMIEPTASKELQIAAHFHDIERLYRKVNRNNYSNFLEYKAAHARIGAKLATELLKCNKKINERSLNKIYFLIKNHEFGGKDHELVVLRDADAIAFFLGDIEYYKKRRSDVELKNKLIFTYNRLSNRGREIVKEMARSNPKINEEFLKISMNMLS